MGHVEDDGSGLSPDRSDAPRAAADRAVRNRQGGASLVEFALITPFLFLILFGIIEFGFVFNTSIGFRSGVREGARQGAVANWDSAPSCPLNSPTGSPGTQRLMCLTKNRIGHDAKDTYVNIQFSDNFRSVGTPLVVCAMAPIKSVTGLFSQFLDGKFYKSKVEIAIEQKSARPEDPGLEAPPPGGDWSWC